MKNIEINTKAVKKLFAAGLLTFTMTGCAGNGEPVKDDKPKEDKTEETMIVQGGEEEELQVIELSREETEKITEGQEFKVEGNKIKYPNEDVLEKNGLVAEVTYKVQEAKKDEEYSESYITTDYSVPFGSYETFYQAEDGTDMKQKSELIGIKIVPILRIEQDPETGEYYKIVAVSDGEFSILMINPKNVEVLQGKISLNVDEHQKVYTNIA